MSLRRPRHPPDGIIANPYGFDFNTYGVRVPAVIVSPYIPPGSKIRPPSAPYGRPTTPFDHTSIIKTVRELFSLGGALTARDDAAPSLLDALSLSVPANDGPPSIDPALVAPPVTQLVARSASQPNGMQASLAAAATSLPTAPPATDEQMPESTAPASIAYPTVATAAASAIARTNLFLGVWTPTETIDT